MQLKKLRLVLGLTRHPHQQAIAQVPLFQVYALLCLWILGRNLSKFVCEAMQQEKSVSTQRFTVMISSACWHLHRASITIKLLGLATQHCLQDKPTEQELELAQVTTTCLAPVCARSQAIATCQSLSCRCRGRQVFEQYSNIFCDNTEVSSAARTASRFSFSLWSDVAEHSSSSTLPLRDKLSVNESWRLLQWVWGPNACHQNFKQLTNQKAFGIHVQVYTMAYYILIYERKLYTKTYVQVCGSASGIRTRYQWVEAG